MVNQPTSLWHLFQFASHLLALEPLARCPPLVGKTYSALCNQQDILPLSKNSGFWAWSFVSQESPGESALMKYIEATPYSIPLSAPHAQLLYFYGYFALWNWQAILLFSKSSNFWSRSFVPQESPGECTLMKYIEATWYFISLSALRAQTLYFYGYFALRRQQAPFDCQDRHTHLHLAKWWRLLLQRQLFKRESSSSTMTSL